MADEQEIRATEPQYPLASALGGFVRSGAEGLRKLASQPSSSAIDRATGVLASSGAEMGESIADFLDRIAYGEKHTTGKGMTLGLKPGTLEVVTALAPAAAGAGKAAWKAAGPVARALNQPAGVLAAGAGRVPGTTLGEVLQPEQYTLKSLERLPQNRDVIPAQMLREQLARADVSKPEKDVLGRIVGERTSLTASELAQGVKRETGKYELKAKDSTQWADYGLEAINRKPPGEWEPMTQRELSASGMQNIRTTQWELPTPHGDTGNHFNNPSYFGHTRTFEENGIPHVVEIQSDLAQKAGKILSAEERSSLEVKQKEHLRLAELGKNLAPSAPYIDNLRASVAKMDAIDPKFIDAQADYFRSSVYDTLSRIPGSDSSAAKGLRIVLANPEVLREGIIPGENTIAFAHMARDLKSALSGFSGYHRLKADEVAAKLKSQATNESLSPMFKNWDRRLVREELSRAGNPRPNPEYAAEAALLRRMKRGADDFHSRQGQLKPEESKGYYEGVAEQEKKLSKIPKTLPPQKVVRFADADTVAKVEGWPETITPEFIADRRSFEAAQGMGANSPMVQETSRYEDDMLRGQKFKPEHQGIYDRYKKETEKYLMSLGGKEHIDAHGHRWIEVPAKSGRTPLFSMTGAAAAGGLATSQSKKED